MLLVIQDIVNRHCADLTHHQQAELVQEILLRIDENYLVLPKDHQLALMVQANTEIDPKHW